MGQPVVACFCCKTRPPQVLDPSTKALNLGPSAQQLSALSKGKTQPHHTQIHLTSGVSIGNRCLPLNGKQQVAWHTTARHMCVRMRNGMLHRTRPPLHHHKLVCQLCVTVCNTNVRPLSHLLQASSSCWRCNPAEYSEV
jgi:hypothetical protein